MHANEIKPNDNASKYSSESIIEFINHNNIELTSSNIIKSSELDNSSSFNLNDSTYNDLSQVLTPYLHEI